MNSLPLIPIICATILVVVLFAKSLVKLYDLTEDLVSSYRDKTVLWWSILVVSTIWVIILGVILRELIWFIFTWRQ